MASDYWRRFCNLQRYAFWLGDNRVLKVPFEVGNHIEHGEASELVDEMCEEIASLKRQLEAVSQRDTSVVTRLEVIDADGRSYSNWGAENCKIAFQDDGRTMKFFADGRDVRVRAGTAAAELEEHRTWQRNVLKVERCSDQSVRIVTTSCRTASLLEGLAKNLRHGGLDGE